MIHLDIELPYIIIYLLIGILYSLWTLTENRSRYFESMYMKRLTPPDFYPFALHDLFQMLCLSVFGPIALILYLSDWLWQKMPTVVLFKISYKQEDGDN